MAVVLDWSGINGAPRATVGPLAPCELCGKPALLRHPETRKPCHKICAEKAIEAEARAANPPRKEAP